MIVKIKSITESFYDGTAESLTITTTQGVVSILDHHIDYLANTIPGEALINGEKKIPLHQNGVLFVQENVCWVLLT